MAVRREIPVVPEHAHGPPRHARGPIDRAKEEASSLKVLFRQFGEDASTLVQEEITLAKLEMRREARAITTDLVKVGIALGIALLGALAFTAFLILVVGQLLDEAFWAGALIVSALFLLIGGLLARNAMKDLKKRNLKPEDTVETLREDKRWAKQEAQEFKREFSSTGRH
jgi:uncharacterized membrane protein YqjE